MTDKPLAMTLLYRLAVMSVALFVVTGCASTETTSQPANGAEEERRAEAGISVAPYETFNPDQFEERPPRLEATMVEHAVPPQLLEVRADRGVEQVVDGFQIQVYSSLDRSAAEEVRREVQNWWEEHQDSERANLFPEGMPINIEFGQPYYRVRIGAFAERESALEALQFVRRTFDDAFLARAQVTITR
ncbi:MAG: SPOR domain-containing protein [Longimonas sp.]|uniref:SPOR domain-containing protein n=1 Tax=Longimonas sp. TaxID=2039626 RepID=UPI0033507EB4